MMESDSRSFFLCHTLRKSLQTTSVLSETSKLFFGQPATSFLVCSLIFIEYQFEWKMESYHLVMS
ncbi:hypothetical protein SPAR52_2193 [Streptococcus pneumoniae GA17971]|nr:hypothetical protein SPAR52_2193 [Streptococcus pneumoniae GA17971]